MAFLCRYCAPEVLRGELLDLKKMYPVDMWAFGLVVFEILYEEEPYYNLKFQQLRQYVGEQEKGPQIPGTIFFSFNQYSVNSLSK